MNKVLDTMKQLYPSTLSTEEKVKHLKMWRKQAEDRKDLYPWYTTATEVLEWIKEEFYKLGKQH